MSLDVMSGKTETLDNFLITKSPQAEVLFVAAIPHSGTHIPEISVPHLNLQNPAFRHDPDHGAEQIYDLTELGAVVLSTYINRDVVDLNRDSFDDPDRGIIAALGFNGSQLITVPYSDEERETLLGQVYYPFHDALKNSMDRLRESQGKAFVINGHTSASVTNTLGVMQGHSVEKRPSFCIGTNDRTTAEPIILDSFEEALRGYAKVLDDSSVEVDKPFKGAVGITRMYGLPGVGYNAILLEVNRGLFFDESTKTIRQDDLNAVKEIVRATVQDILVYLR